MSETLFAKIWNSHVVKEQENESSLIYIDRHLIHEVTSPQAFEGLRSNNRKVRRPDLTIATVDHNIPTTDRSLPILDETSSIQIKTLEQNCHDFDIKLFGKSSKNQGIVHVIGPQLGITLPGTTIVCGDSHTSTQGAFGAFAFGIGTSDVEHVLATQTLWLEKPKSFEIIATGKRKNSFTITSKDIILSIIRHIGTAGGTGHVLEYSGDAISELSMEQRMTICNMSIEGGSRAGLIAPDAKTLEYIKNRPYAPKGENWNMAVNFWKTLPSDEGSTYDKKIDINGSTIVPQVTWGTSPQDVAPINGKVPDPEDLCPM
jgi:3-isopropylmalate/(R)-2-methylmalate dehydratase large subunit